MASALSDRQAVWAFVLGCVAVTAGVVAHLPMFAMARAMHYHMAGMKMDNVMLGGMALIVLGTLVTAYGLLPRNVAAQRAAAADIVVVAPEDARLGAAHWGLMAVLVIALIIDAMKPASLGFTVPGMIAEYGVPKKTVSLVPHCHRIGAVGLDRRRLWPQGVDPAVGGHVRRHLDLRRDAQPRLKYHDVLHDGRGGGRDAAGHLRASRRDDAEPPSRMEPGAGRRARRGRRLFLGERAVGGAAANLRLASPVAGEPAGRADAGAAPCADPESTKFLLARGRVQEAKAVMRRFGAHATHASAAVVAGKRASHALIGLTLYGKLAALSIGALSWGLVNFGLLLVLRLELAGSGSPVLPVALLIVGTNGIIAIVLPYTAESFPLRVRGRATGWVAACTKGGGLMAQGLMIGGITLSMGVSSALVMIPTALALILVACFGRETRGRDLRDLDHG